MKATIRGVEGVRKVLSDSKTFFDPRGYVQLGSKLDVEMLIVTPPDGLDPDDMIRDDPDGWRALLENAQTVVDYVIAAGTAHLTAQSTFIEREQVARELLPILLATENDLQQHYNIQRLALKLHLDERTLIGWAQQQRQRNGRVLLTPQQLPPALQPKKPEPAPEAEFTKPGLAVERYCLGMLLQRPRLWPLANRKLRELAEEAPAAKSALGPLAADDFVQSDFRMIFECLQKAVAQDDQEHLDYLHQHLPYDLYQEVDRLLVEHIAAYKDWLSEPMHTDFEAIRRETERVKTLMGRIDNERPRTILEQKVLELRKLRLIRENMDIQFLQQDADFTTAREFDRKVSINNLAILHIDKALRSNKGGASRRG